jgi:hypothetical protein
MSINDFYSKLMSGNEEGSLFEGLRRMRGIGRPALASGEEEGWAYWTEDGTQSGTAQPGWTHWETEGEALSQA